MDLHLLCVVHVSVFKLVLYTLPKVLIFISCIDILVLPISDLSNVNSMVCIWQVSSANPVFGQGLF